MSTLARGIGSPNGTFKGQNFMTPEYVESGRIRPGLWYEISKGRGMSDEPIYAVTIRPDTTPRLSKLTGGTFASALAYITELAEVAT